MKNLLTAFFLVLVAASAAAKKGTLADHFILQGRIFEVDIMDGGEKPASNVQVVIYQDGEIYVAFYADAQGGYEFFLPVGATYEVWFGGSTFVNKKVRIDARQCPSSRTEQEIELDMGLFRPMDNVDFSLLNDPFVLFGWDSEYGQFVPDMEYTDQRSRELEKIFKKARKSPASRS